MRLHRPAFAAGLRAVLPQLLGVAPFGLVTGVAMTAAGLSLAATMAMSLLVFAGASQLAAVQLLAAGAPALLVVLTTAVINLRHVMYSAALRPVFGRLPLRARLAVSALLTDNAFANSAARAARHADDPGAFSYYLGISLPIWAVWQATVLAGALAGAALPAAWRLEFCVTLAFIAMTVPLLRDRPMVLAALAAGITAVAAHALPMRLGLLVAAAVGIAAGYLAETLVTRRRTV